MIEFLRGQPAQYRDQITALLEAEAVQMSVLLHMDFATTPLRLSNRNVPFVDLENGHTWGAGSGLLVGLPDVGAADGELAPFREYRLGVPSDWIDGDYWAAGLISAVADVSEYRGRSLGLYGQIFDPNTGQPVGHPFAFDVGQMDQMTVTSVKEGAIASVTSESFMARKGVPIYGQQTYFDQKRRHPTDEGLQFVTESGEMVQWTDW
jgi:hypothetical protein